MTLHDDDFCVVCGKGPRKNVPMHPVKTVDKGYVCETCKDYEGQKEDFNL